MKTKRQLIILTLAVAWISGAAFLADNGLQFLAFALPGTAAASLFYAGFSRRFRRLPLIIMAAMAVWTSMAFFIGSRDCCVSEREFHENRHRMSLDGTYSELKTSAAVGFEIFQLCIPGLLLGFVGLWYVKRRRKEESERLEWEIEHSPESQPFPKISVEDFGSLAAPAPQYSFYCYCGMEVLDELPRSVRIFAAACPSCGYEYDVSQNGRRWTITACR